MRLSHIIEQVYFKPWCITPSAWSAIDRLIDSKLAASPETVAAAIRSAEFALESDAHFKINSRSDSSSNGSRNRIPALKLRSRTIGSHTRQKMRPDAKTEFVNEMTNIDLVVSSGSSSKDL